MHTKPKKQEEPKIPSKPWKRIHTNKKQKNTHVTIHEYQWKINRISTIKDKTRKNIQTRMQKTQIRNEYVDKENEKYV